MSKAEQELEEALPMLPLEGSSSDNSAQGAVDEASTSSIPPPPYQPAANDTSRAKPPSPSFHFDYIEGLKFAGALFAILAIFLPCLAAFLWVLKTCIRLVLPKDRK